MLSGIASGARRRDNVIPTVTIVPHNRPRAPHSGRHAGPCPAVIAEWLIQAAGDLETGRRGVTPIRAGVAASAVRWRSGRPLEAKAFLTVDANFTQVHDSEPSITHACTFDRFGRRRSMGIDIARTRGSSATGCWSSAKAAFRRCKSRKRLYSE
jgi:hypothetical protein